MPDLGDYGVVRTSGWGAALIRFGTHSNYNHAFVYVGDGQIVEAEPQGARLGSVTEYGNVLWSRVPLDGPQRGAIAAIARKMIGTPYNWVDIAALTLACLGLKLPPVMDRVRDDRQLICSQLVDRAYELAGVHLFKDGRPDEAVTPGDLARLIEEKHA
jgi:cell wall-associated NlpC family hydrolase